MKKRMIDRFFFVLCLGILSAFLSTGLVFAQECENPKAVTFSIVPAMETMQDLALYQPVLKHLKEVTGKEINFFMPTSRASVIEAMMNKFVDIAVHVPYT